MPRSLGLQVVAALVFVALLVGWAHLRTAAASIPDPLNGPEAHNGPSQVTGSLGISHGIASGDVTATSAIIWARTNGRATMLAELDTDPSFPRPQAAATALAEAATDYTGQVRAERLTPDMRYAYRVWFEGVDASGGATRSETRVGSFKTAPDAAASGPITFIFSADLGGSSYCRSVDRGYSIFSAMEPLRPDFFVALGDMIYADHTCSTRGPDGRQNIRKEVPDIDGATVDWNNAAEVRNIYLSNWRYNRADASFQSFLASTAMYSLWDDHEVINNFGGAWPNWPAAPERGGYPNLVQAGRDAFFLYSPVEKHPADPGRTYRLFSWGKDLDVFLLDTRSYRTANSVLDRPGSGKTMLGPEQLHWLKNSLSRSSATWKVVASSVPLSAGSLDSPSLGADGWARPTSGLAAGTGFEEELLDIVKFLDDEGIQNVVFLTGDVHRALSVQYEVDANNDGKPVVFHELVAGPLSAKPGSASNPALSPTLNPRIRYGEGEIFNFGYVRIVAQPDGQVHFVAEVRGDDGTPRPGSLMDLVPQKVSQASPAPMSPADGAGLTSLSTTLSWTNPPGTTQNHLQVIPANGDGPAINLIRNVETSLTVPAPLLGQGPYILLPDMTYTWRVRATTKRVFAPEDDPSWSPWSEPRTFRTPVRDSSRITAVAPADGATVGSGPITLRWSNADNDVFYYEVQVSPDPTFETDPAEATAPVWWNLVHGGVSSPVNSWQTPSLEAGTTYFWRVRPRVQGDGTPVGWGPTWSFRTLRARNRHR